LRLNAAALTEIWQHADKGRPPLIFAPPITMPGAAEKFEFRAIYIRKNLRVGVWSAIYPITLG
jgi:hypothetical protein